MTQTKKTVYILGAGFSAPAGIPTMADFISKAKDIDDDDIKELLKKIRDFSVIKNYCKSDLSNLEEAFSILAADDLISGSDNAELMKSFIEKTIKSCTPEINLTPDKNLHSSEDNWVNYIIKGKYEKIFHFLSRVMLLKFKKEGNGEKCLKIERMDWKEHNDIITFNYDTLLENCIEILNSRVSKESEVHLELEPILYKLHGSVGCNNIVPPTWAKMGAKNLNEIWRRAFKKISNANRLVFIGYSLPESDAYFRCFLKSALSKAEKLEEIKVVCKDEKDMVEKNYEEFSSPVKFKFINEKWEKVVPGFDIKSDVQSSGNPSIKQSWWIEENDPKNIFGWG